MEQIVRIAELLRARDSIDAEIAVITGRLMTSGHLGEWIASRVFDIELEPSAAAAAMDGWFRSGAFGGRTVSVKWYLKREGLLDMSSSPVLDYYLVLAGPASAAASSRGSIRPWWDAAEIYPRESSRFPLAAAQAEMLALLRA